MDLRLRACIAISTLLLAGCAGQGTPTTAPTTSLPTQDALPSDVPLGTKAIAQVFVGAPGGGAEPNIVAAPDGTLYIASPASIWRSSDAGATWTEVGDGKVDGGGDADIAVDQAGNLYWLGLFGDSGPIPFQVSRDQGESWSDPVDVSDGTGSDREWLHVTPEGAVYTTWRGESGLEFRASLDGGATWQDKVTAAPDGNQGPVTHANGRTYLVAADFGSPAGGDAQLHVYTSDDDGKAWEGHVAAAIPQSAAGETNGYITDFPVATVDGNGTVYLAYVANLGAAGVVAPGQASLFGIFLVRSFDRGATWDAPMLLSDPTKDARMPWVAAGSAGRIAVAWYENVHGVPGESLPDEWNVMMWHSITADAAAPAGSTVMLTSEPNHLGALCTSGTGCLVSDRSLLDFFEVAITPDGKPVAAWASSTLGTGLGVAVDGTDIYFGGIADAPRLQ